MKLYSVRQMLFVALVTATVATAVVLVAVGAFGDSEGEPVVGVGESAGNSGEVFALETSPNTTPELVPVDIPPQGYGDDERENINVYETRNEGVVNITTETVAYNWFLEPVPQEGTTGSGSIIDARGYVLTNRHVVEGALNVFVTLADGTRIQGEVIGSDPENDLSVIEFDPGDRELVTIPMGSSEGLRVGQKVLAIGNPFGLDRTLTTGIVSGLGRPLRARNDLVIRDMIQTDASINPGNSGGPLLNAAGEMIGINTMIYSPSGGSIGIGFAVPVDTAKRVVPDLIRYGVVKRGWIDIVPREIIPQLARYANLPISRGVLVSEVIDGGNAEAAGLRGGDPRNAVRYGRTIIYLGGDIIVEVDGTEINSLANLYEALEDNTPGETVTVSYLRNRRGPFETELELSERPERAQWD
jgi:S1-C subfamily serine protease